MALEIKVSSDNANRQLDALAARIDAVAARFQNFGSTPSFDNFIAKVANFKGFQSSALNSLMALQSATAGMTQSAQHVGDLAQALQRLSQINMSQVAANAQALSRALASIQVPPNIQNLANNLNMIASAATGASASVARLSQQMAGLQVPQGFTQAAQGLQTMSRQTQQASSGVNLFASSARMATLALGAMGVSLGVVGFVNFIQDAYQASVAMDRFLVSMRMATGSNDGARQSFSYLRDVARSTGQTIESLLDPFRKFMQAGTSAGYSTDQLQKVFTKFSAVFRTFGLTSEQTKRSFTALEQMMAKGTVSMEELRQQLGENVPAFSFLAKAMNVSEAALSKMISEGKVGSNVLGKLADVMFDAANKSGAFAEALNKPAAKLAQFQNAWFEFSASFGTNFIEPVIAALGMFSEALGMNANSAVEWGRALGSFLGYTVGGIIVLLAGLTRGIRMLGEDFNTITRATALVAAGFVALGETFVQTAEAIGRGIAMIWDGITTLDFSKVTAGLDVASNAVSNFGSNWQRNWVIAGQATDTTRVKTEDAGSSFRNTSSAAENLAGDIGNLARQTGSAASSMNSAKGAADSYANSLRNVSAAQQSALNGRTDLPIVRDGDPRNMTDPYHFSRRGREPANAVYDPSTGYYPLAGGGGYTSNYENSSYYRTGQRASGQEDIGAHWYKDGGISGSGRKRPVPASAFINAPHFAEGGISDGGIPAVLHPNEAVIPLQGGGVPVNLNGGSSNRADALLLRMVQCCYDIKQETMEVRQSIIDASVLAINEFKILQTAVRDGNSILAGIRSSIGSLGSSSGSGSGSGSGSSAGGGSAASGGGVGGGEIASPIGATGGIFGGAGGFGGGGNKIMDKDTGQWYRPADPYREPGAELTYLNGQYGWFKPTMPPNGFATGSPNAVQDMMRGPGGGFQATLHPNEAVIPLPDGRSVPVDLSGTEMMQSMDRYLQEGGARPSASGGAQPAQVTQQIRVTINVMAKDADSFRASKNQIAQDTMAELQRALKIVGTKNSTDDPTKRAT
jgi:tape measure domain-containing protein